MADNLNRYKRGLKCDFTKWFNALWVSLLILIGLLTVFYDWCTDEFFSKLVVLFSGFLVYGVIIVGIVLVEDKMYNFIDVNIELIEIENDFNVFILEKVTYVIEPKLHISKESVARINSTVKYFVKEVNQK